MFQILDYVLLAIMVISGLLAMARGLMRELFSLAAWALAGFAGWQAIKNKQIMDFASPHFDKPGLAQIVVGVGTLLVVLVILSIIVVKVSDRVVDSRVGAFDRTLGLLFGLARGLVFVAILYSFYEWLVPAEKQEDWVRNAKSLPIIASTANTIRNITPQWVRDQIAPAEPKGNGPDLGAAKPENGGYTQGQQQGMDNLVKGATGTSQ